MCRLVLAVFAPPSPAAATSTPAPAIAAVAAFLAVLGLHALVVARLVDRPGGAVILGRAVGSMLVSRIGLVGRSLRAILALGVFCHAISLAVAPSAPPSAAPATSVAVVAFAVLALGPLAGNRVFALVRCIGT